MEKKKKVKIYEDIYIVWGQGRLLCSPYVPCSDEHPLDWYQGDETAR